MKLVTLPEMQEIERQADANGLTYDEMMEHAGSGLAEEIDRRYETLKEEGALGLVGSGNNGGDALVALEKLAKEGWKTAAYIVLKRPADDPLIKRFRAAGGKIYISEEDKNLKKLKDLVAENMVLVDGVLGTGIKLPLRGQVAEALAAVKQAIASADEYKQVVAVDCPSGVDSDTGDAAPETIQADLTVTMAAVKRGLLDFPASELAGEIVVVGIGLEQSGLQIKAWDSIKRMVADAGMVREWLPARPGNAHKGTFGTALVIAGSINYTGAALLSGKAAYRVGAGLVTLAIPSPLHSALAGQFPEATWLLLPHEIGVIAQGAVEVIRENLERPTAMLLGPGFGTEDTTKEFITRLIGAESARHRRSIGFIPPAEAEHASGKNQLPPMVIDADGLKLLAGIPNWHANLPEGMVLTPHPGEMSVLTGLPVEEIQADRLGVAEKYANEWRHIVVLKGANTVIAKPGGDTVVIPVASAALARAGTGDVLAGLITGLRAQGVEGFQAAVSGCWIHAQAGLLAAEYLGNTASVLAGDVLDSVAEVLSELILGDEAKNRSE